MKNVTEVHEDLDRFDENGSVGLFMAHRGPGGSLLVELEQTVKMKELDEDCQDALLVLASHLNFMKAEIICNTNDGLPDRIRVTRRV
jgi:hypothetical protein